MVGRGHNRIFMNLLDIPVFCHLIFLVYNQQEIAPDIAVRGAGPVASKTNHNTDVSAGCSTENNSFGEWQSAIKVLTAPVLVLNLNYVPINISTARRAIILVGKGKAELLEQRDGQVRTISQKVNVPSIIRLVYLVKRPFVPSKLSKKEIFLRDQYTCQYCGIKSSELTLDHVIPRRQKGAHTWENVVAACSKCNLRKAGFTPEEAKMRLLREPKIPQPNPYRMLQERTILDEWKPYLPWALSK